MEIKEEIHLQNNLSKNGNSLEKKVYSFEEAIKLSTEYFKGDALAATVFVNKYALKDSYGKIYEATPDDMHERLADEIARIENKYSNPINKKEIYNLLKDFKYVIPQGSPMTGIGNEYQIASLSNCFVLGNEADSYGGIMQIDQQQVQLMKRRGGVGHDLSHIRPMGSPVENSALTSTGIAPFMERYSNSTREVAQDGRRGALMLSLSIKHPDAEKFIDAKLDGKKVTGANISVRIDDEFMKAIKGDGIYTQKYPVDSDAPYFKREIEARGLWKKIIHNAWKSAEPGILFWDTIIRESIPDCYADKGFKTASTNPCGEIPLCPYDSCRLLAMNLYNYVEAPFTNKAEFNFNLFKKHAHSAQKISDDIIDLEIEKVDKILNKIKKDPEDDEIKRNEIKLWENIRKKAEEGRRMGLGITAEGDMLAALGLRYGSEEAIDFSTKVHKTLAVEVYKSSVNLAKERGAFKIYNAEKEKDNPFIQRIKEADSQLYDEMSKYGRRNIALLTIAPTGTVSLMTQTTSGLEPVFLPVYKRRRKVNPNDKNIKVAFTDEIGDSWEEYSVFHPKFEKWLAINKHDVNEVKKLDDAKLEEIVQKSPYYKATSNDVDWISKVKFQGAVQKWVDHSISVTINLPKDVSEDLVDKLYQTAWEEGCKGVTIYREGSRSGVLISNKKENLEKNEDKKTLIEKINALGRIEKFRLLQYLVKERLEEKRPENIVGRTAKVPTPYDKKAFVDLRLEKDENNETIGAYEAFIRVGKSGGDLSAITEGYGRILSVALKGGIPLEELIEQLSEIGGETQHGLGENKVKSLPDAIAKGLQETLDIENKYSGNGNKKNKNKELSKSENLCSQCGSQLIMQEGCEKGSSCGYHKC